MSSAFDLIGPKGAVLPAARGTRVQSATALWWLKPDLLIVGVILPVYLSFALFSFDGVVPRAWLPGPMYAWGAALLLALALGAALARGAGAPLPRRQVQPVSVPAWLMLLLLALTLAAYMVWFAPLALRPYLIKQILFEGRGSVRDVVSTTPGITTLTQCGVAYAIACVIKHRAEPRGLARWEQMGLALIVALTLFRVLAWAERLALIELAGALFVAWLAFARQPQGAAGLLARAAPLLAPLLLYLGFTATEYVRAWDFYADRYDSLWRFSLERLLAYYATASNNGIGLLVETADWPRFTGGWVFEWAYQLPAIGELLSAGIGDVRSEYWRFLRAHARPEFNNPSGLFVIVHDVGLFGSALYFLAAGIVVGLAYRAWAGGALGGWLAFPSCYLFVAELLRFNYFSASRFVPVAASLLLVWLVTRRASALRR